MHFIALSKGVLEYCHSSDKEKTVTDLNFQYVTDNDKYQCWLCSDLKVDIFLNFLRLIFRLKGMENLNLIYPL